MAFAKGKIGLVLLGATEFPKASDKFSASEAFLNAKEKIRSYFCSRFGLREPENILDLFDQDLSSDDVDREISDFIKSKENTISDLVIFYVGHGGYDNSNGGFLLAIRKSRSNNLGVSSLTAASLGKTLSLVATRMRIYLILDCCFSGDFVNKFQAQHLDIVYREISHNFPENGLALLCSSSKQKPSIIIREGKMTMFSEAFELALQNGSREIKREYLTLRELGNLTFSYIKNNNPGEAVRPEVHTPKMPSGDIADLPQFPNAAFLKGTDIAFDIEARKQEILELLMNNRLDLIKSLLLSFVKDFDSERRFIRECIKIGPRCTDLEQRSQAIKISDDRKEYEHQREILYDQIMNIVFGIYPY